MELNLRQAALIIARGRAVNGLVMLALPGVFGTALLGRKATTPALRATLRLMGARELVLGVGAITTVKEHTMDAEWVGMGAVVDAIDGAVMLTAPGIAPRARLASIIGATSATIGLLAAREMADERVVDESEIDS
jgi:hypothetical protein